MRQLSASRGNGAGHRGSVRVLPAKLLPIEEEDRKVAIASLTELLLAGMVAAMRRAKMSPLRSSLERLFEDKESA